MARPSPQTDRVVSLLTLLAATPGRSLTLAELTRRLDVNKSTCHAMLTALTTAGWLLRDPRRKTYRLGPALIALGRKAAEGFPALEFARAAVAELSLALHLHCAALSVDDGTVTVLDQVHDPAARGIGFHAGMSYPLRPPFGAAVLAFGDRAAVDAWLQTAPPDRQEHYEAALAAVRGRGYAVELAPAPVAAYRRLLAELDERLPGPLDRPLEEVFAQLADLAEQENYLALALDDDATYRVNDLNAPVFDESGRVTLLLALTGFTKPLPGREVAAIGRRLADAARGITAALGGPVRA